MAKLSESKGKSGEGFTLIFGNEQMGVLFSKVQSTMIRGGFELEQLLKVFVPENIQTTLEAVGSEVQSNSDIPSIQVVFKPTRPDPDNPGKSVEADLLVVNNIQRRFSLVEIKEGYVFDTKKADGELASLKKITSWLAQEFAYRTQYFICAFNQENKEEIVRGTKRRFSIEHVMTGRELCEMIGIDYEALRQVRSINQAENRQFFFAELLAIPQIRDEIETLLNSKRQIE